MLETEQQELQKIEKLLQDNLHSNAEILAIANSIQKSLRWQTIWSIGRFVLIIIPIIIGFIYLPPLVKDALQSYQQLLMR